MLKEGLTDDINGSVGGAEKTFSINFSKAKTKFCLSLLTEKESISLKEIIKNVNFFYKADLINFTMSRQKKCF